MEAPSPAPILIAEPIEENKFIIDNTDTSINITLQNNNDRFNKVININDDYWKKNKKFYQDSFDLFIKTLKNTLIEKIGDLTFEINKLDEENINVELKYSSMFFGFTTEIILVKILTEKEELVNQVKELQKQSLTTELVLEKILKENNDLKSQVRYLTKQITIINEEIGLGKLKKQLDSKKKLKLIKVSNVNELMRDLLDLPSDEFMRRTLENRINDILSKISCYGSVRSGRVLKVDEMNALLREIEKTPNSGQCNHGRPTHIFLSQKEIEKLFERI